VDAQPAKARLADALKVQEIKLDESNSSKDA